MVGGTVETIGRLPGCILTCRARTFWVCATWHGGCERVGLRFPDLGVAFPDSVVDATVPGCCQRGACIPPHCGYYFPFNSAYPGWRSAIWRIWDGLYAWVVFIARLYGSFASGCGDGGTAGVLRERALLPPRLCRLPSYVQTTFFVRAQRALAASARFACAAVRRPATCLPFTAYWPATQPAATCALRLFTRFLCPTTRLPS